ncbi:GH25 family lysozyme [Devosia sp.]|uniref:GH25 family lysozyme n=1 Tax=Devosia sp. TaxID=1871048 RepID=UPI003266A92C
MSIAAKSPFVPGVVRGLLLALALLTLAACGRGGIGGAIEGDNRPHSGVARARALPIQGMDIARYQGNVDFYAARNYGIHFAFMKSTEGKDYIDPNFYNNWNRAREAGMPRGAYHFMTWCSLASEQADWFIKMVPNDPDALPPVLDLEWNNDSSCKTHPTRENALEKVRYMLAAMEAHTGKLPIIYTDMTFHRDVLEGEHFPNAFWLRSTAAEPHHKYTNRPGWTFWQWTQTGVVRGVRPEVDRNAFYGTQDEWTNFLLTGCDPRAIAVLGPYGRCALQK